MNWPNDSALPPPISAPNSIIRFFISGAASTAFNSRFSRSTTSRGVPAGAITPYQAPA